MKDLLKTKEVKNPVIFSDQSLGELTVLHMAAYFGHLNIIILYKDVLTISNINPKDNKGAEYLVFPSYNSLKTTEKYTNWYQSYEIKSRS